MQTLLRSLTLSVAMFAPFLAQASGGGRCILSELDAVDAEKPKATLILVKDLDVSGPVKTRVFASNDGKTKLFIQKTTAREGASLIQVSVSVNDATLLRATTQSNGTSIGVQTAIALPDGHALYLTCSALPPF